MSKCRNVEMSKCRNVEMSNCRNVEISNICRVVGSYWLPCTYIFVYECFLNFEICISNCFCLCCCCFIIPCPRVQSLILHITAQHCHPHNSITNRATACLSARQWLVYAAGLQFKLCEAAPTASNHFYFLECYMLYVEVCKCWHVQMSKCRNVEMSKWRNVEMTICSNEHMFKWANVDMSKWPNVEIKKCRNKEMSKCRNVEMSKFQIFLGL